MKAHLLTNDKSHALDFMAKQAQAKSGVWGINCSFKGVETGKPFELAPANGIQTLYDRDQSPKHLNLNLLLIC